MKKTLFGKYIPANCAYCDNYSIEENRCIKRKTIKNGACRRFAYNPTLRKPESEAVMMQFSREDFEL